MKSVKTKAPIEVWNQVQKCVECWWGRVWDQAELQVKNQVRNQVNNQVLEQVWDDLK